MIRGFLSSDNRFVRGFLDEVIRGSGDSGRFNDVAHVFGLDASLADFEDDGTSIAAD